MSFIAINSEAEWLAIREQNIGGSEAAALFANWNVDGQSHVFHAYEDVPEAAHYAGSCSPYSNAYKLFLHKSGQIMPPDFSSERMQAGTYLEPAIAEWARNKFDMKLRKVRRYHLHPEIDGWGASVDYEVHGPGMDPVEIKNVDALIAKRDWVIEGDEVISTPLHISLQLQHYIGARNAERGWIIANVGGNHLVRGEVKRHEPTIARLREAIPAFWNALRANQPPVRFAEFEDVAEEFTFGGAAFTDLTDNPEAGMLARKLKRIQKHLKAIEARESNIKGRLGALIGGASKATLPGFRVSWPVITREAKMIPAKMQEAKTYRGGFTLTANKE